MTTGAIRPHVQHVLDAFDNVRVSGNEWSARCPGHRDRKNSLSIGIGDDGAVVLHCHAGCDPGMVLYHKGLTFADLYPPRDGIVFGNGHGHRSPEPPPADAPPEPDAAVPKPESAGHPDHALRDSQSLGRTRGRSHVQAL